MGSVSLSNIHHSFGETCVLKDVNLTIQEGELFTLLGSSGCGKTTLLRILAGFLQPTSGRVLVDGADITNLPPEKRNISMVFQNYALFPTMTVEENVSYGLKVQKLARKEREERCTQFLSLVGMEEYRKRKISALSGGQQQRVALARALAVHPRILLLDEPLSNLDAALREKMRDEIRSLQQRLGITTVFITHDQNEALSISDRIAVMKDGACLQQGTPHELYHFPANGYVAGFIGESTVLTAEDCTALGLPGGAAGSFLRPEQIRICPAGSSGCPARIEKVFFHGSTVRYELNASGKILHALELSGPIQHTAGEQVALQFAAGQGGQV